MKKSTMKNKRDRTTKPIRIDSALHKRLKIVAAANDMTIKELVEYTLRENLPDMGDVK